MALTQKDLDRLGCMNPGCNHKAHSDGYVFSGKCHIGKPVKAVYVNGTVRVFCAHCERLIVEVAVAP